MKEQLLRDLLVVGITDKKLSEQLQMDAGLMLEKAKKTILQKEAVRKQCSDLMGKSNQSLNLEVIKERKNSSGKWSKGGPRGQPQTME